jgi:hypothetical protein
VWALVYMKKWSSTASARNRCVHCHTVASKAVQQSLGHGSLGRGPEEEPLALH